MFRQKDKMTSLLSLTLFSTEFSPTSKPLKCRSPLLLNLQQKAGSLGDFKVKETSYNTSQSKALIFNMGSPILKNTTTIQANRHFGALFSPTGVFYEGAQAIRATFYTPCLKHSA